jgi:transcriptional regulator with XRE-family HTH domain
MDPVSEKSEKVTPPGLAIDGIRIRNLRETKKLTQLYVASVVGVTTDTISRWENNRYPSIKRENAEKLAGALEVDLADILQPEESGQVAEAAPASPAAPGNRLLVFSGLSALAIIFLAIFFITRHPSSAPTALRWTPSFAAPGEIVPVQVRVTRPAGANIGFILKEKLPEGFRLVSALPASSAAESSGTAIKWLIPGGNASVTVSYSLQIPASPSLRKEAKLSGEIVLHEGSSNRTEAVSGKDKISIGDYHWADANGDGRIDDDEIMPAYYICEEMKGLGLDWKTIEAIWSGKGYRWDPQGGFTVIK